MREAAGVIDGVLTFAELKEMFTTKGITPEMEGEESFSGPKPDLGRLFPLSKGLFRVARLPDDIVKNDTINAHGKSYVIKIIGFAEGEITARVINIHFCHGCIDGPVIDNELSGFRRKELVANYTVTRQTRLKPRRIFSSMPALTSAASLLLKASG